MKKSKIIVPAMCLIAFTSFASIAGSVAWFTASRQVSLDAGTYAVVKTTTNLKVEAAAGVGTAVSGSWEKKSLAVSLQSKAKLTDGSFDHKTGYFTTPNANGDGIAAENGQFSLTDAELSDKLERATLDDGGTVYTAVTFNLAFTMNFGAISGDYGLFLDNSASSFTVANSAAPVTATGFRMAFFPLKIGDVAHGSAKVFADLQVKAGCSYVAKDAAGLIKTGYTVEDNDIIDSASDSAAPAANATRAQAIGQDNYLGYFAYAASTEVQLKYTVVAWFEGTDVNIVNQDDALKYQSVVARLSFLAEPIAAA